MIYELSPLHDHHGKLVCVVCLISVNHGAYQTRVGEWTIGDGPPKLLNSITRVTLFSVCTVAIAAYL